MGKHDICLNQKSQTRENLSACIPFILVFLQQCAASTWACAASCLLSNQKEKTRQQCHCRLHRELKDAKEIQHYKPHPKTPTLNDTFKWQFANFRYVPPALSPVIPQNRSNQEQQTKELFAIPSLIIKSVTFNKIKRIKSYQCKSENSHNITQRIWLIS